MTDFKRDVNILFWDIETLPYKGYFWGIWEQNIPHAFIQKDKSIICISYKWFGEELVHTINIGQDPERFERDPYDDSYVISEFLKVLNEADFVVAHNGDKFDYPILKARSIIHDLPAFQVRKVDTLKMAKGCGQMPRGNSLKQLALTLGLDVQKGGTSIQWWIDIAEKSSPEALDKMLHYCDDDVRVLEAVFEKLWPHCERILPNIHRLVGGSRDVTACSRCGSVNYRKHNKYIKNVQVFQRYICKDCGATFLGAKALTPEEINDGQ
jgi:hypothetical protein